MKTALAMLLPLLLWGHSYGLKAYIDHASTHNAQLHAKAITLHAKQKVIDASLATYWPTVDIGANYTHHAEKSMTIPGEVGTLFVSAHYSLYDGGRKDALLRSKRYEKRASRFEEKALRKSITLQIIQYYYGILKIRVSLKALRQRAKELQTQIDRTIRLHTSGLSTTAMIERLQAAFDNNAYTLANARLLLKKSQENLTLLSGLSAMTIRENHFKEPRHLKMRYAEPIRIMRASAAALEENTHAIEAGYAPQVSLSDTFSLTHAADTLPSPFPSAKSNQNTLTLSVGMRLFDHGKIREESEALRYNRLALLSKIAYAKKEQRMHFRLAKAQLETTRTKIKSAKSALKSTRSNYASIKKKFESGLVDTIAYLDALTQQTAALAQYKEARYEYEIEKSLYYYYAGRDPRHYIQ